MWMRFPGPAKIRCSFIVAVLESYDIVRRQCSLWQRLIPDDWEVVLLDDGSSPPIQKPAPAPKFFSMVYTRDVRPWTQPLARNLGGRLARGEYLFFTDIDHILTPEAVDAATRFTGDRMLFPRDFAVLTESGEVDTEPESLKSNGWTPEQAESLESGGRIHANTFVIRRELFLDEMHGGYDEALGSRGQYGGDDIEFNQRYAALVASRRAAADVLGPRIYVYPDPASNPQFHPLRRDDTPPKETESC